MTDNISVKQAKTLDGLFNERIKRSPQGEAYRYFYQLSEQWHSHTWEQMDQAVARWQAALTKAALAPPHRVATLPPHPTVLQTPARPLTA